MMTARLCAHDKIPQETNQPLAQMKKVNNTFFFFFFFFFALKSSIVLASLALTLEH